MQQQGSKMIDLLGKAQVLAVTSPGGMRHELCDIDKDVRSVQERAGVIHYFLLEVDAPAGRVSILFPPNTEELGQWVKEALTCHIPAEYQPERWVNDHAVPIRDDFTWFNALPVLIQMDLPTVQKTFSTRSDFDCLAEGLPEAEEHDGPFEVSIEEKDVLDMICLLSGRVDVRSNYASMANVEPANWDKFCAAARSILALHEQTKPEAEDPKLLIDGNEFTFKGTPGDGAGQVVTTWAQPPGDDAVRLAMGLMESQILALYSAGVLWSQRDGFDGRVVEALQTTFDAIPKLIDDLDEPLDAKKEGAGRERNN